MEAGNFKDALNLLDKSIKMNQQVLGETHVSNCNIYSVMAQVYTKLKDHSKALKFLLDIYELQKQEYGEDSEQVGNTYLEVAKVHFKDRHFDEAIQFQSDAMKIFEKLDKFEGSDYLANIAITLS